MERTIKLPLDTFHVSVADAISKTLEAARFPAAFDVFVEVKVDENGNEFCPDDGEIQFAQTDGKELGGRLLKASFVSFCKATGVNPRNPYAPWVFDYDSANESHDGLYQITVDELRRFAVAYGVGVTESKAPTNFGPLDDASALHGQESPIGVSEQEIPGALPKNSVGKLAVKAAWAIERDVKRRATDKEVMSKLQEWADNGTEADVLKNSDKEKRAVIWITSRYKDKPYTLEACQKTLQSWNASRE